MLLVCQSPSQVSGTWERLHLSRWQLARKLEKSGRWMLSCRASRKSSVSWKREGYWDHSCQTQSKKSRKTGACRGEKRRKKKIEWRGEGKKEKEVTKRRRRVDTVISELNMTTHLLFVIVTVIVDAAVETVAGHHPFLLHQALEAVLCPTVGVTHDLHEAGHHAAHVSVLRLCSSKTVGAVWRLVNPALFHYLTH